MPVSKKYSDAEVKRAVNLAEGAGTTTAAKELGIPRQTIDQWLQADRAGTLGIETSPQAGMSEAEALRLKDRVRELETELKRVRRDENELTRVREFIGVTKKQLTEPPKWIPKLRKGVSLPGVPLAMWSDWHLYEVVKSEQVAGINEFNIDIARQRVKRLVEKIISLCFKYSHRPEYPGIVVAMLGDMISGFLHDLPETNQGTIVEQVKGAYEIILQALLTLADKFGRVFVVCIVGNHGRLTFKPRTKNRVQDNIEWMLYGFLQSRLESDKRFQFYVPEDTEALFSVVGHRFLAMHGDSTGARGGDGIIGAIGPIVRGEKKVRDVQNLIDLPYDTAILGHYHQKVSLDNVIANPTLKGYDEYVKNVMRARPERPAQMLLFVHPKYGIADERRIFLDTPKPKTASSFVEWPGEGDKTK